MKQWAVVLVLPSLFGCGGVAKSPAVPPVVQFQLTATVTEGGTVVSVPAGVNCPGTCTGKFDSGTAITLTAAATTGFNFSGFGGACSAMTCKLVLTSNQTVTATFTAQAPPSDFSLTATPSSQTVAAGNTTTYTTTIGAQNGFSGTVALSVSGLPNGATASFSPATTTGSGSSTLTVTTSGTTPVGTSTLTITGTSGSLTQTTDATLVVSATADLSSVQHFVFMVQENRSFDHYFGHLPDYWAANNFPQATNGTTLDVESSSDFNLDSTGAKIPTFELITQCLENPSPSWDESHRDFNLHDPTTASSTYLGDGFVRTAASENQLYDTLGHRAMGYFTDKTLNYYYFIASTFGTSDRFFSPVLARSELNRMYMYAATSQGHAAPLNASHAPSLTSKTLQQLMDENHISWKIYVHPDPDGCATPQCLDTHTYLQGFTYNKFVMDNEPEKIAPLSEYFDDLTAGTLPQVSFIEPASSVSLDEHPTNDCPGGVCDPTVIPVRVQTGAQYVEHIISSLAKSSAWASSVFVLTWDEGGGFYDHAAPVPFPNPDGINPIDLGIPGLSIVCVNPDGTPVNTPICTFQTTGYRLPVVVVSPFSKANYVSHTPMDYTAVLKLIEKRFGLPALNARDAAQPDMSEFFDFTSVPWKTPPTAPAQLLNAPCYLNALP